jgi:D-galactarolactone cycloisomerase
VIQSRRLSRRACLRAIAASSLASMAARPLDDQAQAERDTLSRVTIRGVSGFHVRSPRLKYVGKNARLDDHGDHTAEDILRLRTSDGREGIGLGRLEPKQAESIIGLRLDQLWCPDTGSIGPLGRADHALFDLVGKILDKPAWQLLGGRGSSLCPLYDGSIYFNDLLATPGPQGIERLIHEVDQSLDRGHRAFKLKVGRGHKWMEPETGLKSDIEIVQAIRERAGPDVLIMVDANNGFSPETARRFLRQTAGADLTWIEEPFPESVEEDRQLRDFLRDEGLKTLLADGESAAHSDHFSPFLHAGVLDVLQPDIRAFGLSLLWALARTVEAFPGVRIAPHNWGSALGHLMIATLGRGLPAIWMAEQDTADCAVLDTSAFRFQDGKLSVPDTPGCGFTLREDLYSRDFERNAWTVGKF